jgi:ribosomal protein S18 acetylase RimI-like enzyme
MDPFTISPIESQQDLKDTIFLFEQYAKSLGIDLSFQDFETEMASMPGKYASPNGCLLLARSENTGTTVGCVGLRQLGSNGVCEMKRLYVDPKGRGLGVGKALATAVIQEAKRSGYHCIRLDTLPSMASARALYKSLGFVEIDPYYDTPIEGTIFLELSLRSDAAT